MINLSIIIPHYNSTESLKRLLSTIPIREDLEVIIVDDRSNKEEQVELKILENDNTSKNIHFLHNTNDSKGAGVCRNIGLKHATGNWILFADADDYFVSDFYSIVSSYFSSKVEVVFFIPTSINVDTGKKSNRHISYEKLIFDYLHNNDEHSELFLRYYFHVPWSKLIKASFLKENDIFFDEVIASNDVMFSTRVGNHMRIFEVSRKVIYCVTENRGTLTTTISEKNFDTRLTIFINYHHFLKQKLSKESFRILKLSGREMILQSITSKFGVKKTLNVLYLLRKNKIEILSLRLLNPLLLLRGTISNYKEYMNKKKYSTL